MSRVRVASFAISIDGFGAGPDQSLQNPLGVGGKSLHEWFFKTDTFQTKLGNKTGLRDRDDQWKGWWGTSPPYHVPVFVLTHHPRASITMEGGTTFHFVTEGIHEALAQAKHAAAGRDVRLGGGVETIRQYLMAGLVDELHLVISPVLLGSGEHLLNGINMASLGYQCVEHVTTEYATHIVLNKH